MFIPNRPSNVPIMCVHGPLSEINVPTNEKKKLYIFGVHCMVAIQLLAAAQHLGFSELKPTN